MMFTHYVFLVLAYSIFDCVCYETDANKNLHPASISGHSVTAFKGDLTIPDGDDQLRLQDRPTGEIDLSVAEYASWMSFTIFGVLGFLFSGYTLRHLIAHIMRVGLRGLRFDIIVRVHHEHAMTEFFIRGHPDVQDLELGIQTQERQVVDSVEINNISTSIQSALPDNEEFYDPLHV